MSKKDYLISLLFTSFLISDAQDKTSPFMNCSFFDMIDVLQLLALQVLSNEVISSLRAFGDCETLTAQSGLFGCRQVISGNALIELSMLSRQSK